MGSGYITGKVNVGAYKYTGVDTATADTTVDNTNRTIAVDVDVAEVTKDCQPTLVSGENIKTINGESLLGRGDIGVVVDAYTRAESDARFVAKEEGKGLSTNDFTNTLKDKLDNIAAGAQVNVIESVTVNGAALPIVNKVVDIDTSNFVTLTGDQTITGDKNFTGSTFSVNTGSFSIGYSDGGYIAGSDALYIVGYKEVEGTSVFHDNAVFTSIITGSDWGEHGLIVPSTSSWDEDRAIATTLDVEEVADDLADVEEECLSKVPHFFDGFASGRDVDLQVAEGQIKYCTYGTAGGSSPYIQLHWTQNAKKAIYLNTIYVKYIDKNEEEQEYTYTFSSKVFTAVNQSIDLGGLTWRLTDPNTSCYFGYSSSYGQQVGSTSQAAFDLTLSTEDLAGCLIKEVNVTTCGASGTLARLNITVGEDVWLYHEGEEDEATFVQIPDRNVSASVNFTHGEGTLLPEGEPDVYEQEFIYKENGELLTKQAEQKVIYANLDDEKIYRYNGTTLIEISRVLELGNTNTTAYRGDYGQQNYDRLQNIFSGASTFAGAKTFTGLVSFEAGTSSDANIAQAYDTEDDYVVGDFRYYSGLLYRCIEDIAAPAGEFDITKWERATMVDYTDNRVAGAFAQLNSAIEAEASRALVAEGSLSNTTVKLTGDQTVGGNKTFTGNIILTGFLTGNANNSHGLSIPDTSSWSANKTIATEDQIPSVWYGTAEEYAALGTYDSDTLYYILEN